MNEQEIFDTVVRHLGKQGKPAIVRGRCRYRTDDGLSCAVGCLIPDENYHGGLEGHGASNNVVRGALPEDVRPHTKLLERLQQVHDLNFEADAGRSAVQRVTNALRVAAAEFGLRPEVIAEAFPHS